MKKCKVCGLQKDANPAHGGDYSGVGKHDFTKSLAFDIDGAGDELKVILNDDSPVAFGGAVKALGIEKVDGVDFGVLEGPAVIFTKSDDTDLSKEFFNSDTDFFFETDDSKAVRPVIFDHGLDETLKSTKLARTSLEIRDEEVWFKTQLDLSKKYNKYVYKLAELGELGTSTGSAPHLIQREKVGKSTWIKAWPIVELSFTTKPVDPKTKGQVLALKSYSEIERPAFMKAVSKLPGAEELTPPPPTGEELNKQIASGGSIKGLFETKLAQKTESVWDLHRTFEEVCRDIEQAAEAESITGVTIDVDAKVAEAGQAYFSRMVPLAAQQIRDFLDAKEKNVTGCSEHFYLRAFPESALKALIGVDDSLVTEGKLDEHSDKVVSAVEEYASNSKALVPKVLGWVKRVKEKFEFRSGDSAKAGRKLSKATLDKLAQVEADYAQALKEGADALAALRTLIEAASEKKAITDVVYNQLMYELAVSTHHQEMALAGLDTAA